MWDPESFCILSDWQTWHRTDPRDASEGLGFGKSALRQMGNGSQGTDIRFVWSGMRY